MKDGLEERSTNPAARRLSSGGYRHAASGLGLVIVGVLIAMIGLVWLLAPSIPWLGKLPGGIAIERDNVRFYFPLATCVLLSLVLTGIMWLVRYFTR